MEDDCHDPDPAPSPAPDGDSDNNPNDPTDDEDDPCPSCLPAPTDGVDESESCDTPICDALNWYNQNILAYQYTPIAMSSIQYLTGNWMTMLEPAMILPDFAPIAVPLYILSFAENRVASFVGWQAVDYQYDHNLYNVSQLDVYLAGGTLLLGTIPPLAPYVSDISFGWDITHTNWKDFP